MEEPTPKLSSDRFFVKYVKDPYFIYTCKSVGYTFIGLSIVGLFLLTIILPALTVNKTVNQSEVCVTYNSFTKQFGSKIYTQGSYTLNVGDSYKCFQRTIQSLDKLATFDCLSNDKVKINIDMSIQYQIMIDEIVNIFMLFDTDENYVSFLNMIVSSSISNICSQYTAEQFYNIRSIIDSVIQQNLIDIFKSTYVMATLEQYQLINIDFPTEYINAISAKQNTQQKINTALNQRNSSITNAQTKITLMEQSALVIINNATLKSQININNANNIYNITFTKLKSQADGYFTTMTNLGINGSELIKYIETTLYQTKSIFIKN